MGARWPSGLERWTGDQVVQSSNPAAATSLRNFGNSVYPALPVSFGGNTKSRRSLLSGVYARGSKISHQSALEICNLSWTPPLVEKDNSKHNHVYNTVIGTKFATTIKAKAGRFVAVFVSRLDPDTTEADMKKKKTKKYVYLT